MLKVSGLANFNSLNPAILSYPADCRCL